jgi:hypothetical protein
MGKLGDVDFNTSHVIVAILSALGGYYGGNYLSERRKAEKRQDALDFARIAAPYIAAEIRGKGIPQTEACTATEELVQVLKEVKDVLKEYRGDK